MIVGIDYVTLRNQYIYNICLLYTSFELEGGNFSKAGYASSQIKKVLKQLAIDPRIIKRVVVALYEAEVNIVAHAWRRCV